MQQKKSRREKKSFLPKKKFEIFEKYPIKLWIPFILLIIIFAASYFLSGSLSKEFANIVDYIIKIVIIIGIILGVIVFFLFSKKIRLLRFFIFGAIIFLTLFFIFYKFLR